MPPKRKVKSGKMDARKTREQVSNHPTPTALAEAGTAAARAMNEALDGVLMSPTPTTPTPAPIVPQPHTLAHTPGNMDPTPMPPSEARDELSQEEYPTVDQEAPVLVTLFTILTGDLTNTSNEELFKGLALLRNYIVLRSHRFSPQHQFLLKEVMRHVEHLALPRMYGTAIPTTDIGTQTQAPPPQTVGQGTGPEDPGRNSLRKFLTGAQGFSRT